MRILTPIPTANSVLSQRTAALGCPQPSSVAASHHVKLTNGDREVSTGSSQVMLKLRPLKVSHGFVCPHLIPHAAPPTMCRLRQWWWVCHASVLSGARGPGQTCLEKFLGKATWIWGESGPLITFEDTKGGKRKWKKGKLVQ